MDEGAGQRETATQGVPKPRYAWCFSHGRMHTFYDDREPWCTADWMPLFAQQESIATEEHASVWGGAQFSHELSDVDQMRLLAVSRFRDSERKRLSP